MLSTTTAPLKNPEQYEVSDLETFWEMDTAGEIGIILRPDDLADIAAQVEKVLAKPPQGLIDFQKRYVANFGAAGPFIADWLEEKSRSLEAGRSQ